MSLPLGEERTQLGYAPRSEFDPERTSARTEIGDGFDLHQDFRRRKRSHFYKRGSRKVSGEELAARSPDLGVFLDIDDVDRHLYQVVHRSPGRFDNAINT